MPTTRASSPSAPRSTAAVVKRRVSPPRPRRRPRPHRQHKWAAETPAFTSSTTKRRPPLHTYPRHPHRATLWLGAILGAIVLSLAIASSALAAEEEGAKEGSANGLNCLGHISTGEAELGSSEQQVRYTFYCNGPITGYSLESNVPLTGYGPKPIVANNKPEVLSGPFDLGRPLHCPKSKTYPGGTRLEPATLKPLAKANKHKKTKGKAKGTSK